MINSTSGGISLLRKAKRAADFDTAPSIKAASDVSGGSFVVKSMRCREPGATFISRGPSESAGATKSESEPEADI
ncbi:hypothetical protein B0H19DRAFT_1121751 [Mycena capillaripes]|nr:hypothetical protein B0H19DRAFT_1121751 [Mycena capillaripes]